MNNLCTEKKLLSKNEKLEILQKYFSESINQTKLRKIYNIKNIGYISNWIRTFNKILESYKLPLIINQKDNKLIIDKNLNLIDKLKEIQIETKDQKQITYEKKIDIINHYLTTDITLNKIEIKYDLSGKVHIYRWKKQVIERIKLKLGIKKKLNKSEKRVLFLLENTKQKKQNYSTEFKIAVTQDYLQSNKSQTEIAQKYKINSTQVSNWSNKYKNNIYNDNLNYNKKHFEEEKMIEQNINFTKTKLRNNIKKNGMTDRTKEESDLLTLKYEELEKKYKLLKIDLEHAELERDINKKIIEIAERELKINIRKK